MRNEEAGRPPELGRRKATVVVTVSTIALTLVATACGGGEGDAEAAEGPAPVVVEAVRAWTDTIFVSIRSVGSLEASRSVEARAETTGRISEILFEEGATVERGDTLLRLDQQKLRASLQQARAALTRARSEESNLARQYRRNEQLLESGAISEQAFDDLEASYEAAQARLEEARANLSLARAQLEDATIRASFTGQVGARAADEGQYVQPGTPLFVLVDNDPLEIGFSVPERYIGRLDRGSPVSLRVSSFPDTTFQGTVTYVSPVVDAETRTVEMKARIPNEDGMLRAGQFANVRLSLERRTDAVLVPEAAIVPRSGESVVFLVRDGVAVRREIRTGERLRGRVEITEGVTSGDTVVVAGQQTLQDETPVDLTLRPGLREEVTPDAPGDTAVRRVDPPAEAPGADGDGPDEPEASPEG